MNDKLFGLFRDHCVPEHHVGEGKDRNRHGGNPADFPAGVPCASLKDESQDDRIVFEPFARLGMILVVLNLLPADAGGGHKIALEVFIRDTAVLLRKIINRLGKILICLADCWVDSKQFHTSSISAASEMSLYQLLARRQRTKLNLGVLDEPSLAFQFESPILNVEGGH